MKAPHLWAATAAMALLGAALGGAALHARAREAHSVHTLAAQMFPQKMRGTALQRAAFRHADLLPLYGSSDLNVPDRYHPSALFREYPTGFTVFPVGDLGSASLIWLQALAAVGGELHGQRVAISLPLRAFLGDGADPHAYAANFSRLHAGALAFDTSLSFALKQSAARRMLAYPQTLAGDPLLRFALQRLAGGSPLDRVVYAATVPLGKLHNALLQLQDHWATLAFLDTQPGMHPLPRRPSAIDWAGLAAQADADTRRRADNNSFGFANAFWMARAPDIARQKDQYSPETALRLSRDSAEWTDFELLLRGIEELGGTAVVLAIPMKGPYYDYLGVSADVRRAVGARVRALTAAHGITLVDFAEHDADPHFTADTSAHLSSRGWIHVDRALDAFVNGPSAGSS